MANTLSALQGALILVTTMFGGGILFLPASIFHMGWLPASALFFITVIFIGLTMYFLCACAEIIQKRKAADKEGEQDSSGLITYAEVMKKSYSFLSPVIDLLVSSLGFLACMTYVSLITKSLVGLFDCEKYRIFVLAGLVILVFFLGVNKDLSSLAWASYLSIGCVCSLTLLIIYIFALNLMKSGNVLDVTAQNLKDNITSLEYKVSGKMIDINNFGKSFGYIIFAMACQQNMLSVYSQLSDKNDTFKTILLACFIGPLIYYLVAMFGYFGIGEESKTSVLSLLSDSKSHLVCKLAAQGKAVEWITKAVVFMFCVVLTCSCAFQLNPAKISVANLINLIPMSGKKGSRVNSENDENTESDQKKSTIYDKMVYHIVTTFVVCVLVFLLNIKQLPIEIVVSLIGAVAGNCISFIFPAVAYYGVASKNKSFMAQDKKSKKRESIVKWTAVFTAFLGVGAMSYSVYCSYREYVENKK